MSRNIAARMLRNTLTRRRPLTECRLTVLSPFSVRATCITVPALLAHAVVAQDALELNQGSRSWLAVPRYLPGESRRARDTVNIYCYASFAMH